MSDKPADVPPPLMPIRAHFDFVPPDLPPRPRVISPSILNEPVLPPLPLPQALILVTATVEVYGTAPGEGELVRYVEPVWRAILKLLESDPDALFKIPPRELEQLA